jgi:hypothetical protein
MHFGGRNPDAARERHVSGKDKWTASELKCTPNLTYGKGAVKDSRPGKLRNATRDAAAAGGDKAGDSTGVIISLE